MVKWQWLIWVSVITKVSILLILECLPSISLPLKPSASILKGWALEVICRHSSFVIYFRGSINIALHLWASRVSNGETTPYDHTAMETYTAFFLGVPASTISWHQNFSVFARHLLQEHVSCMNQWNLIQLHLYYESQAGNWQHQLLFGY